MLCGCSAPYIALELMKFFLPAAENSTEAESVLLSIAKFINAPVPARRIYRMAFVHNGTKYKVEIGKPAPEYFGEKSSPVVAILGKEPICICLANRGVLAGSPILVASGSTSEIEYFEAP